MRQQTRKPLAELKLLAQPEMISTAKRTASSLGSLVGFSLEDIDELNIAVAQACDSAIAAGREAWGDDATLKLTFWSNDRGLEVAFKSNFGFLLLSEKSVVGRQSQALDEFPQQIDQLLARCAVG